MAKWGGWQILPLKSKLDKIDKNNLLEPWDLTRGMKKYDKLLCLKTAELQVRTGRVCGAISEACSHLPTAQLMGSSCRNVVWGRLGGPELRHLMKGGSLDWEQMPCTMHCMWKWHFPEKLNSSSSLTQCIPDWSWSMQSSSKLFTHSWLTLK